MSSFAPEQGSQGAWSASPPVRTGVVRTGPSGLVLGAGPNGPIAARVFRPRGTRLVVSAPQYVSWLVTFRCISLGAHVSITSAQPQQWQALVETIRAHGGTSDLLESNARSLPEAGRPYRPSLLVTDPGSGGVSLPAVGPWQAALAIADLSSQNAVQVLRSADLALVTPDGEEEVEALRRAYFLNARQVRACELLAGDEVMLAMPRRVVKLSLRPKPLEYQLLFAGR